MFSKLLAFALKVLTDVAQVPVSTLGKMFKTNFFPAKVLNEATDKSFCTNLKSANCDPTAGNSPDV